MENSHFERHRPLLERACEAVSARTFWSPYPEVPSGKIYGEDAMAQGRAAYEARLGAPFSLDQPNAGDRWTGSEVSPFGPELGVTYPMSGIDELVEAAGEAGTAWGTASIKTRVGICLEVLDRLHKRSFEMAYAVMHTTGQSFIMAFQAGGPHSQDRGLEAVTHAYNAMTAVPQEPIIWEKPQGKHPPIVLEKRYRVVPRGIGLVIGCSTFPTWNSYPGLFADLATGNPVIVKPHPRAVLPLAITVSVIREVLAESGFDPNVVTLAADSPDNPIADDLAVRPEIKLVDFTGSTAFGDWIEANARQAQVYTEKAGVNAVVIGDFADFKGLSRNLAFAFSLYSGQMCTTPQNVFVPADGIETADARLSFNEVASALAGSVEKFLSDPARAVDVLGAIQNQATLERLDSARGAGEIALDSKAVEHPEFPDATIRTPLFVKLDTNDRSSYAEECFGPVVFVVPCTDIGDAIARMEASVSAGGAITAAIYADDDAVLSQAEDAAARAGVNLSCNLTGNIYVNQAAAFSDFHATGGNPAGNCTLTDQAFVMGRFRVVQSRIPVQSDAA